VGAAGVLLALSFAGPWLADRYSGQAAQVWPARPRLAFDKLDAASRLDPLSPRPKVLAGSIALRLGRLRLAERYFRDAIDRDPHYAAAYLELGAIVLDRGRRAQGLGLLARAAQLQPRDDVTAAALRRAGRGKRIDIAKMNEALRRRTVRLGR
jgi:tetratricopeptide (TPR) repeat protein